MAVRHSDGSSAEAIVTSVNEKTSVDENRPQVDKRVELEARRAERERERERRGPDRERQQAASPRRSREADSVVPGQGNFVHINLSSSALSCFQPRLLACFFCYNGLLVHSRKLIAV